MKKLIKYFERRKEERRKKEEEQEYIVKRVIEASLEDYRNRNKPKENKNSKQYFFDSETYGKVFNK